MNKSTSNERLLNTWLSRLSRLFDVSPDDINAIRSNKNVRNGIWKYLANLDSGRLSSIGRVFVYTSIAQYLEEDGENPTEALLKAKHLIIASGGKTIVFEANNYFFFPIEDTAIGSKPRFILIGETPQGAPIRSRIIPLILIAHTSDELHQQIEVNLNQCGFSSKPLDLDTELFTEPMTLSLYMTADYLEEDFQFLRKHVFDFKLIAAEPVFKSR
jgi:hypothetical protein